MALSAQMDAEMIMDEAACHADWSVESQLSVALAYIENQQANEAFSDYVQERVEEEDQYG